MSNLILVRHLDHGIHVLWLVSVLTVWILSPSQVETLEKDKFLLKQILEAMAQLAAEVAAVVKGAGLKAAAEKLEKELKAVLETLEEKKN